MTEKNLFCLNVTVILLLSACSDKPSVEELEATQTAETDLRMDSTLTSPETILPGQKIRVTTSLINSSATNTHRVIRPGDGSYSGAREPYIYYSVQFQESTGKWSELPRTPIAGCGVYDIHWPKTFADLAPKETFDLGDQGAPVEREFEFQKAGNYRIRCHYSYRGGTTGMSKADAKIFREKNIPKAVKSIPVFHIISNPVEVTVESPLSIRFGLKRPAIREYNKRLSDLFNLALINDSQEPLTLLSNFGLRFEVLWNGHHSFETLGTKIKAHEKVSKVVLAPGESISLLGGEKGMEGKWDFPMDGSAKVRVIYHVYGLMRDATFKSEWILVESTEKPTE